MPRTATTPAQNSPTPAPAGDAPAADHAAPPVTLRPGDPAPDFCLRGDDDQEHRLADLAGRPVVLYFYPKDNTPGCTTQACDFRDLGSAFRERGAVVIGVSGDSVRSHQGFKARHGLPFLLLSDPGHAVARRYGAFGEKVLYGRRSQGVIRSTFLIDWAGGQARIARVYGKVSVKGHAAAVLSAL